MSVVFITFFCSCFMASHSFNHGKILDPGENYFTQGTGRREYIDVNEYSNGDYVLDSAGNMVMEDTTKTIEISTFKSLSISLDSRWGVLAKYPFGGGLDIGMHFEGPTQMNRQAAALLQFDTRAGFKDIEIVNGLVHTSLGAGWIIGAWVDNGWFTEIAAGWEHKTFSPYCNTQIALTPTDFSVYETIVDDTTDNEFNFGRFGESHRLLTVRHSVGIVVTLPRVFLLPDYFIPEVSVFYPHFHYLKKYGATFQLGLRWHNGF